MPIKPGPLSEDPLQGVFQEKLDGIFNLPGVIKIVFMRSSTFYFFGRYSRQSYFIGVFA
ncbi:hypothetical protein BJ917_1413 [Pseudomonas sp. WPR_5_2]|nr:hypothetical protein BJ917_1413 [Pseudomonas sp. WPR_5_2]